ncbi:MAG: chemotaxis protein CheW [Gammaproteobacteria bacterium]
MAARLSEIRDRPFELLQELERRGRVVASGRGREGAQQEEWMGVGFRVGHVLLVAARDEVREVLPFPGITRLPGAKPWLMGIANVRGQLLAVTDLNAFLGGAPTDIGRSARVVVVNHNEILAGLLVDEVRGFRRFVPAEKVASTPDVASGMLPFVTTAYRSGDELWGVLSLPGLVEASSFLSAAG